MMSIGGYVFGKLFQRHPMARGYAWKRDRGVCQICGRSAGHRENNFGCCTIGIIGMSAGDRVSGRCGFSR